jgi:prepilin-type N-terminal cleavage/methylation domain-containing protein
MNRAHHQRGFTLLEVMVAMAILSGALTWLVVGVSRNVRAENHAKLMTTATFLARGKMVELEDALYEKGFGEFEKDDQGGFEDRGFSRFTWTTVVDKVELPSGEALQTVLSNAQQARQTLAGGNDPNAAGVVPNIPGLGGGGSGGSDSANPLTASAGMLSSQYGIIKDVLEQGIRRVTVRVQWFEGTRPQSVELVTYYTDVRRVDQAIQIGAGAGAAAGAGGAAGASGAGGRGGAGG